MSDNNEIILDEKSGISIEEQQEILTQINGIAERNRRLLSEKASGKGKKILIKARKSGAFFPVIVNLSAIIILCAGAFFLVYFNAIKDIQIKTGTAGYDLVLLAGVQHETSDELAFARRELELLTTERERIDHADSQVSNGLIEISDLIRVNEFNFAEERVIFWQNYLSFDIIATSPTFQSRREFYEELLNFTNTLIEDARKQFDLIVLVAAQEQAIAENEELIISLRTDITDNERTITSLRTGITDNERTISSLRGDISALEAEKTRLETENNRLVEGIRALAPTD